MVEIAPGLRRWTAFHDDWEEDVASLAVETSDGSCAKARLTSDPLRLCPGRWLGKGTHDDLHRTLRPLLDLPVERVLVSHGVPILSGGKPALAAALD